MTATRFKRGHTPWNKGKVGLYSEETRQSLRDAILGEKNPMYGKPSTRGFKGKRHSDDLKQRDREANLGEKNPMFGKPGSMLGMHHSERVTQNLRDANLGERNPHWRGGVSFLPYPPEFNSELKLQIKRRDNWKCQLCGVSELETTLQVHHIDGNKNNNGPGNLTPLCPACHGRTQRSRKRRMQSFRERET
jgi:hypothetical protein